MEKITVFLADWQVLFREGIHFTLSGEEDMDVIGEAAENEEALAFIEKTPPNIAILNANHSKLSGVDACRRLKQNLPEVMVILIMDSENEEQLYSAMKSGASACLTKDADPEDVVNLIRGVAQGAQPISEALLRPEIAAHVVEEFEVFTAIGKKVADLLAHLLPVESDILRPIINGTPLEEISKTLNLSEEIIRHHLNLILAKLVANDRSREVIEAAQSGVMPRAGKPGVEYVTREEFNEFKEKLIERFKSLVS